MIKARINYPNPAITIHANPGCGFYPNNNGHQRYWEVNIATLSQRLNEAPHFRFAAQAGSNTLHLEVDFANREFEMAVTKYITALFAARYPPLDVPIHIHCENL